MAASRLLALFLLALLAIQLVSECAAAGADASGSGKSASGKSPRHAKSDDDDQDDEEADDEHDEEDDSDFSDEDDAERDPDADLGDDDMKADFIQFQVEEIQDAFESNDATEIMTAYAEDAKGVWNGKELKDKAEIQAVWSGFIESVAHSRYSVVSQLHEGQRYAAFTRNIYFESTNGCLVPVRSLEEVQLNEKGRIVFFRSEWDQSIESVIEQLKCAGGSQPATQSSQQKSAAATVKSLVSALNGRNAEAVAALYAPQAVFSVVDGTTSTGRDEIQKAYAFLGSVRNVLASSSEVFTDGTRSNFLTTLFISTNKGCASVFVTVDHVEFDGSGLIARHSQRFVGMAGSEFGVWLDQDCSTTAFAEGGDFEAGNKDEL